MTKAISRAVPRANDAPRAAARDASRRTGQSLGEWLQDVIAEHADDNGHELHPSRPVDHRNGRESGTNPSRWASRRDARRGHAEADPRSFGDEASLETVLDEALEAMERRAARSEKRTEEAFASLAHLLEDTEARRQQERSAVTDLGRKLADIETKLVDRRDPQDDRPDGHPIQTAIARLEARLEAIGQRSLGETAAKASAVRGPSERQSAARAPVRGDTARPDAKLDAILARLTDEDYGRTTGISAAALAAHERVEPVAPRDTRGLGSAIAEIATRQHSLDHDGNPVAGLRRRLERDLRPTPSETRDADPTLASMRADMAALAATVEAMRRDLQDQRGLPTVQPGDMAAMRADIRQVSHDLKGIAPGASVRDLRAAIDALDQKMSASPLDGLRDAVLRPVEAVVGDLRDSLAVLDPRAAVAPIEAGLREIGRRLEDVAASGGDGAALAAMRDQMGEVRSVLAARLPAMTRIEDKIGELDDRLERQSFHPSMSHEIGAAIDALRAMAVSPPPSHALASIETRLDALADKIDEATRRAEVASTRSEDIAASSTLEAMLRDLSRKMEDAQQPHGSAVALDALQDQIAALSHRFERSEDGLASLSKLEASMHDLFDHLEVTRASIEVSATRAAREAVRMAEREPRHHPEGATAELAALQMLQEEADSRTQSTLGVVHATLEKVVDRLSAMEHDIAGMRAKPAAPARAAAPEAAPIGSRAPTAAPPQTQRAPKLAFREPSTRDPMIRDPMIREPATRDIAMREPAGPGHPLRDIGRPKARNLDASLGREDDARRDPLFDAMPGERDRAAAQRPTAGSADEENGRADFIAAARRAAKAAQNDPSVLAATKPNAGADGKDARIGLLAKSKDFVATHKRPVLLSIAALFVLMGTIALMQRQGLDTGDQVARREPAAKIARMADAAPAPSADRPSMVASLAPGALSSASSSGVHAGGMTSGALSSNALPTGRAAVPGGRPAEPGRSTALSTPIPGSDPIQTGSIASLPAFAQRSMASAAPASSLPAGLQAAAEAGDGAAEYELATRYADGHGVARDFKLASDWYKKAADANITPAKYRLASLFEKGLGVTLDKARAKSLYLQAAEAGNPRAMHNLAVLLADGDGKPDYVGAALWFRRAAQYGIHDSQYNLAILLARGLGVQQSLVQSFQWFAIAAKADDSDAAKKRDDVATKLGDSDLAAARALAAGFQVKVADPAAVDVRTPAGGWDGAASPSHLNSARSKISML